jgi:hypothetical protein
MEVKAMVWAGEDRLPYRPETENPRDPRCKLALQRICGTCRHYRGDLSPADASATCGFFHLTKRCHARAWDCHRWTRKTEGIDA